MNDKIFFENIGIVKSLGDAVIIIENLKNAFIGELISLKEKNSNILGMVLNIEPTEIKLVLINGSEKNLSAGDFAYKTNKPCYTKAGFSLLGRIITPLGITLNKEDFNIVDYTKKELLNTNVIRVERPAPGIIEREPVRSPFHTGVNAVDTMLPIGFGQRELILGDLSSGKTTLGLTFIINQRYMNTSYWRNFETTLQIDKHMLFVPCVYVVIGGRRSEVLRIKKILQNSKSDSYTTIVFTSADDLAALQYLAPLAGSSIGEWFRDNGYKSVIVFDELSNHASSYRQISLLLRRPPGREAFPGDIFYVHASLLERSAQLHKKLGGGALTGIPLVETKASDISAYIPTNIISITDGQIFISNKLNNKGIKPGIDLNLSVSRVGSDAQYPCLKYTARKIKLDYSYYRAYASLEKMGGELDYSITNYINRGKRIVEFFKQDVYQTTSLCKQVISLYAISEGYLDKVELKSLHYYLDLLFDNKIAASYLPNNLLYLVVENNFIDSIMYCIDFETLKKDIDIWLKLYNSFFISTLKDQINLYNKSL